MVAPSYLGAMIASSIAIILVPGPSVTFVLARAIAWGRSTALLTVLGGALGALVLSTLVALGLGPVFQRYPTVLLVVQALGGAYLLWLGISALRHRREHVDAMLQVEGARPGRGTIVREGFLVGVLNPKSLLFFAAVFPQFIDPAGGPIPLQLLLFGVIFTILAVLFDSMWALVVGSSRDWFATSARRLIALRVIGGLVMVLLGLLVLVPLAWSLVAGRS